MRPPPGLSQDVVSHPGGRPSKLTEERQAKIVSLIREGIPRGTAARASGISESTFHRWMAGESGRFAEFAAAVELAEAQLEAEMLSVVTAAAVTDGRLALKLLERRFPQRWSRAAARAAAESPEPDWR